MVKNSDRAAKSPTEEVSRADPRPDPSVDLRLRNELLQLQTMRARIRIERLVEHNCGGVQA
jgi:hypothetical protein